MTENADAARLPRWEELPDLALYMDQVLSLMERYLGACPGAAGKGLTASMVNNYVKMGAVPPPVKKRYGREHLAMLIMLCLLKQVLPIVSVKMLLDRRIEKDGLSAAYDGFCTLYEQAGQAAAAALEDAEGTGAEQILRAALRAQAEQAVTLRMLAQPEG